MSCPPLNKLLDYSRRKPAEAESAEIKNHLQTGCENCAGRLRWLETVSTLAKQDRAPDISESDIRGIVAWFKSQPAHTAQGVFRKLMASLVFDSLHPDRLEPVRAESGGCLSNASIIRSACGRQMLFQTEGYDIDLRFEAVENKATEELIGQVLSQGGGLSAETAAVQLWRSGNIYGSARTDSQGLFHFGEIASGVYELKIQISGDEINLTDVPTARIE
ncbi:MAG TPA: hypothetical protein PLD20_28550 [Blastocatellia bacterium]|nr:hypothetical protein [Blastocatellia bacterium]HMV87549.1 hypothetical protein [Blastocatellia bacterium]HMX26069.1 hypothetical protein [Blastocatellia bacterium]HMY71356.1 hypothetical protein [Blastocatellia bacterium]HMZ21917.1 hypothetical protein [Blastocatellia bacterium]